jgi:TATA-box binding protein (TBP) (component of TFIID and TFIIIB)
MSNIFDTVKQLNNDAKRLPENISISTMTIVCNIDVNFNVQNIAQNIALTPCGILSVTHGKNDNLLTNRSILPPKADNCKKKNIFYNRMSMHVFIKGEKKPVNVKLFSNGAIQITGCKTTDNAVEALNKILVELQNTEAAENLNILELKNVKNFRIVLTNAYFNTPLPINLPRLHKMLISHKYRTTYNPPMYPLLDLRLKYLDNWMTLFFSKCGVIITASEDYNSTLYGYNFINKYLSENYYQPTLKRNQTIECDDNQMVNYKKSKIDQCDATD